MSFIKNIKSLSDVPTFELEKEQLYDSRGKIVPNTFSIMRSDTRSHFGTCSDKYRPIQVDEMMDIIDTASERLGNVEHTGYTYVGDGKRILIQSRMNDIISTDDDLLEGYLYTLINNTGISANRITPSTMRIVCSNALHLATNAENGFRSTLRHNSNFDVNVDEFVAGLESNMKTVVNFGARMERLRNAKYSKDEMIKLTVRLLPDPKNDKEPSTRLIHKREKVVDLFETGKGNVGLTRWDALNALTEFETHQKFSPEKFVRTLSTSNLSNKALEILDVA